MGNRGAVVDRKIGFYYAIFAVLAATTVASVVGIFTVGTLELALLAFVGMWFTIYWMDMTERRFESTADRIFWCRWFSVRGEHSKDGMSAEKNPTT